MFARQTPRCADCGVGAQIANPLRCFDGSDESQPQHAPQ
jgi:hypothetical protein